MIIYDIDFINNYYKSIMHEKIDSAIESLLNNVLETINLEALVNNYETDNDNKFKKKNKFRKYDNNNNSVNSLSVNSLTLNSISLNSLTLSNSLAKDNFILSRTIKNTYVNTKKKTTEDKSKHETIKSNIKTILNKLSPSNYSKLEPELINIYKECLENSNNNSNSNNNNDPLLLVNIDNYIIEHICYNNLSYSIIYVNILFALIEHTYVKTNNLDVIYIYNALKEKYNEMLKIDNIIKNNTDDDEYTINKINDKYKCFIIFIINFNKKIYYYELENIEKKQYAQQFFINCHVIEDYVALLNNFFITNLKIENNSSYCEIILEFLIIIYNELFKELTIMKIIDNKLNLYNSLKTILANEHDCGLVNFTNKIKFKLMDIEDKYKKYIL
jgi:hypothetical protein